MQHKIEVQVGMMGSQSETPQGREAGGGALFANILLLKIRRCEKGWQEVKHIPEGARESPRAFSCARVYSKVTSLRGQQLPAHGSGSRASASLLPQQQQLGVQRLRDPGTYTGEFGSVSSSVAQPTPLLLGWSLGEKRAPLGAGDRASECGRS